MKKQVLENLVKFNMHCNMEIAMTNYIGLKMVKVEKLEEIAAVFKEVD